MVQAHQYLAMLPITLQDPKFRNHLDPGQLTSYMQSRIRVCQLVHRYFSGKSQDVSRGVPRGKLQDVPKGDLRDGKLASRKDVPRVVPRGRKLVWLSSSVPSWMYRLREVFLQMVYLIL
ncbi:hypothetical protein QYF36_003602 [Acer negundo]|nr:hypothetical protein QYF36_003602 [Acer negundo]